MTVGIRAKLIRLILLLNEMNGESASMGSADTPQNAELRQKWKIKCGKALFTL